MSLCVRRMSLTAQQERFAQLVVSGMSQADAYRAAYDAQRMKPETIYKRACELAKDGKVAGRIDALRNKVAERAMATVSVDRAYVLERLKTVAERCMQTAAVTDRKGNPVATETPDGTLALAYEFDAPGANRALELLGKEIGMFVERKEQGPPGAFSGKETPEEIQKRIDGRKARLQNPEGNVVPIRKESAP